MPPTEAELQDVLRNALNPGQEETAPDTQDSEPESESAEQALEDAGEDEEEGTEPEPVEESAEPEEEEPRGDHPEWFQKRIDKLTALRRSAESERDQLKAELEELRNKAPEAPPAPAPIDRDPYGFSALSESELQERAQAIEKLTSDYEDYLDGLADPDVQRRIEKRLEDEGLTETDLKRERRELQKAAKALADRRKFVEEEKAMSAQVIEAFPFWKDKALSREITAVTDQVFPGLRATNPNWRYHVSVYAAGLNAMQQKKAAGGTAQPRKRPTSQPRPMAAPTESKSARRLDEAKARAMRGTPDDAHEWIHGLLTESLTKGR